MNNSEMVPYLIMALIANFLVFFIALHSIVKANRRDRYARMQINLLIHLAKKAGVSEEDLKKAIEIK